MTRLLALWEGVRTTYWALPSLMTAAAVGLSVGMIQLDELATTKLLGTLPWVYAGGPEGARAVLSTIAGSMIGVAGVTFSITIVALTLASQQFGPRLLRNFLRDLGNQTVLGTFVSTFIYCLLVLRTVRGQDDGVFVPHLAVTGGVVLALLSLGVLIYFIHHISVSIQATQIIGQIGSDLEATIDELFPERLDDPDDSTSAPDDVGPPPVAVRGGTAVRSPANGYVQMIDGGRLVALACEGEWVIRIEVKAGAFVRKQGVLVSVWPTLPAKDAGEGRICDAFIIGDARTPAQTIDFYIRQLVELAGRALSPGVNDPGTALACLDRLEQALCQLAGRRFPSPYLRDPGGTVRVIMAPVAFADIVDSAFDEIRRYGRSSVAVTNRMLDAIREIASCVRRHGDRAALVRHAHDIGRGSPERFPDESDRTRVEQHLRAALAALRAAPGRVDAGPDAIEPETGGLIT